MQNQNSNANDKVRGSDCALICNILQEEFFAHLGIMQCSPRGMPVFLHRVNGGKWDLEGSAHLSVICVRIHQVLCNRHPLANLRPALSCAFWYHLYN